MSDLIQGKTSIRHVHEHTNNVLYKPKQQLSSDGVSRHVCRLEIVLRHYFSWLSLGSCLEFQCLVMSHISWLCLIDCVSVTHSKVLILRWNTGISCWMKTTKPTYSVYLLGWRLSVVASVVRRMNEVTVHWARLVLGWVTVFGRVYHHGV